MLDELREEADSSEYYEVEEDLEEEDPSSYFRMSYDTGYHFLGMTPAQRFILALLLLFMICILGSFTLLITERVIPPIGF